LRRDRAVRRGLAHARPCRHRLRRFEPQIADRRCRVWHATKHRDAILARAAQLARFGLNQEIVGRGHRHGQAP
jgi:hypothetical protein